MTDREYEGDDWELFEKDCFTHPAESFLNITDNLGLRPFADRQDCLLIYRKFKQDNKPLQTPLCAVSFEGSDDENEWQEPAWKLGFSKWHGYLVFRGFQREYSRFAQSKGFQTWRKMFMDPKQCLRRRKMGQIMIGRRKFMGGFYGASEIFLRPRKTKL